MTTTEQATDEVGATGTSSRGPIQGPPASTTASSRRAYERRQRRRQKISATRLVGPGKPVKSALNRAPFVVVLIALLASGIAGVLYLNTMTDEAGMRSSTARSKAIDLRLTIESLQRDVAMLDATPHIADEAAALGMVPAGDSAMLMVDGSGAGSVVGKPSVVPGPVAPVAPVDPAAEALAAQAAGAAAAQASAAADPAAAQAAGAQAAGAQAPADPVAAAQAAEAAAAQAAAPQVDPNAPAQGAQQ